MMDKDKFFEKEIKDVIEAANVLRSKFRRLESSLPKMFMFISCKDNWDELRSAKDKDLMKNINLMLINSLGRFNKQTRFLEEELKQLGTYYNELSNCYEIIEIIKRNDS